MKEKICAPRAAPPTRSAWILRIPRQLRHVSLSTNQIRHPRPPHVSASLTLLPHPPHVHRVPRSHVCGVSHGPGPYICDICDFHCTRTLLWGGHAHNEGLVAQVNQTGRIFRCEVCACTAAGAHGFRRHLSEKKHKSTLQSITG